MAKKYIKGMAINNMDSVISNFDKRDQKRVIRYMQRTLRRKKKELRR